MRAQQVFNPVGRRVHDEAGMTDPRYMALLLDIAARKERGALLEVDDPYPWQPRPRWGHGNAPHAALRDLFDARRSEYIPLLDAMVAHAGRFAAIRRDFDASAPHEPHWDNGWLPSLDGMSIYTLLAQMRPSRFVEVGSGNSTRFAARAIRDCGLATRIVSIDPAPRAEVDRLCHEVVRAPLENVDMAFFDTVTADDLVFVDCSHRAQQNSDVTVFFLEVLPRLPAGCVVGIHDICLPLDYPPGWEGRYYNEQYMLATLLLFGAERFSLLLPGYHVSTTPDLAARLAPLAALPGLAGLPCAGSVFWMRKRA